MSTRAARFEATVGERAAISDHLVSLVLEVDDGFASTGIPDEWVGLIVPGQFQSRYYTVRSCSGREVRLDVVVHDVGLVTEWAMGDCVGDTVQITEPKASFLPPADAQWLMLVGDLTALPAISRICETRPDLPTYVWAEVPDDLAGYLPEHAQVNWSSPPGQARSALADLVASIDWPSGAGYFWMAGESAQMRAIRKHLMREVKLPSTRYDVMGYWRATLAKPTEDDK